MNEIKKYQEELRTLIPKKKNGSPKTDRLDQLDSMLAGERFSWDDLSFIRKEIDSAVELFVKKPDAQNE